MAKLLSECYPITGELYQKQTNGKDTSSRIQEFYKDSSIFITGGTGFLGKVLIEKLLRSCRDIRTIYLLIREKKGKSIHQRLEDLFEDVIFDRLKSEVPKYQHKVVPMSGDCTLSGLGLAIKDRTTLKSEVNMVFHVAATVKFDERLNLAVAINVNATRDLLDLCKQFDKLKALVHVSTAYSNCHLKTIDEIFYQYPVHYDNVSKMLEKLDDRAVDRLTPKILGKWPNTYSFTKAMAEALILEQHEGLPIGIFRPAIVVSTYREPVRGWIDNYYGPTGICAAAMMGVLRTMHCDKDITANIVPVDMCVNALIASAWDIAKKAKQKPPIYNYVSSVENPITWDEYNKINLMYGHQNPMCRAVWKTSFETHSNAKINNLCMLFFHFLPAVFVDVLTLCLGKTPHMLRVYTKVHKFSQIIAHFSTNKWKFSNDNVQKLWTNMSKEDQTLFNFSFRNLDWLEYFRSYVVGIREYLFKEDKSTLPQARRRQYRFSISAVILNAIFYYIATYTILNTFTGFCRLIWTILGLP